MKKKNLKKMAIPFAALAGLLVKEFAGVEIQKEIIEQVVVGIIVILAAFGIISNNDKEE